MQSEYAQLAGMSAVALTAVIASYLPIVRVFFLVWAGSAALRERLIQRIEAVLHPED